jgi:hypothetical protein
MPAPLVVEKWEMQQGIKKGHQPDLRLMSSHLIKRLICRILYGIISAFPSFRSYSSAPGTVAVLVWYRAADVRTGILIRISHAVSVPPAAPNAFDPGS